MKEKILQFLGVTARTWLILKVLAICMALLSAIVYATNSTRLLAIENVSAGFAQVAQFQSNLLTSTSKVISQAYNTKALPDKISLLATKDAANSVLGALSGFNTPNKRVRDSRDAYRRATEQLIGSINAYDGSLEAYTHFQNSSVVVANAGGDFRDEVERFTGSTWHSFWSVF